MWKKLTLIAVLLSLGMLLALPLAAEPGKGKGGGKGGGGGEPVPAGPGLIAFNDSLDYGTYVLTLMNADGSGRTPVTLLEDAYTKPAWSRVFSDGTVKIAFPQYEGEWAVGVYTLGSSPEFVGELRGV